MRVLSLVVSVLILFLSCGVSINENLELSEKDKELVVNKVSKAVGARLRKEKQLVLIGTGGRIREKIEDVYLGFNYSGKIDIEEGRELLIFCIKALSDSINNEKHLCNYLKSNSFDFKNTEIRIFVETPSKDNPLRLSVISFIDGSLKFKIDDPNGPLFKTIHTETYEEALKKLEEQHSKP